MATDNNRTDQSPSDPQYGWRGVSTDLRNRPTPNRLDEMRRCIPAEPTVPADTKIERDSLGGLMETAVEVPRTEVAALSYSLGIHQELARRIIFLERAMENPTLLRTVTDLVNAYGELTVQLAELRQTISTLQAKKKS